MVYTGDCRQLMPLIPEASVDLVMADPPFGIDFKARPGQYNRTASRVMEGYREYQEDYLEFSRAWISQIPRLWHQLK